MGVPEDLEDFLVRNRLGVIFNLADFRMSSLTGAHFLVSWVLLVAAGITTGHRFHARQHLENGLGAPETAAANRGELGRVARAVHNFGLGREGDGADQEQPGRH